MDIKDNINLGILNAAELLLEHGRIPPEQAALIRRRALYDMTKAQVQPAQPTGQPVYFGFDIGRAPSGGVYGRLKNAGVDANKLSDRVKHAIDNNTVGAIVTGSKTKDIDVTIFHCPVHGFEDIAVNLSGENTVYEREDDEFETEFTDRVLREAKANHGEEVKATILDAINEANEKRAQMRR